MGKERRPTSRLICAVTGVAAVAAALAMAVASSISVASSSGRQSSAEGPAPPAPGPRSALTRQGALSLGPHASATAGVRIPHSATRAPQRSAPPRTPAQIGRSALAALRYDVARTGFRVEVLPARDGLLGETLPDSRVIRIYVRPGQSVAQVSHVLAHEVGHAVDIAFLTEPARRRWLARRGADGTSWWPSPGASDFSSGAGDFAEVFAYWALDRSTRFRSTVAPAPSATQLEDLATDFFRRR